MQKVISNAILSFIVFLYAVSNGRIGGQVGSNPVLLLTTTGRKSSKRRTIPLVYIRENAAYVVAASAGGSPRHPGWFFNLRSNPQAMLRVKEKRLAVRGEVAEASRRTELWECIVKAMPEFAELQTRARREVPVVVLHPVDEVAK